MSENETKSDPGEFKVEVKYFDAAINALALDKSEEEAERIHNFGNSILNVAIKTKQQVEKKERE